MANFTVEGRSAQIMGDIQRTFFFQLQFPNVSNMVDVNGISLTKDLTEELLVRTRTCSIPARGLEVIEDVFGVTKQFYPGRPTMSNTFECVIQESENQNAHKILWNWSNSIMNFKSAIITP